ncbi:MAG: MBL fold metallo-hydrolase [Halobacteriovoraceae bacterium]|nr:MBL fold metallo-hydrolase [Halobacteriovoraceae bacterium]
MEKVKVEFFDGGFCYHPEFVALKGGSRKPVKFPAICALIQHPEKGNILFDTGYSEHFYHATRKLPYKIYAKVTPVKVNPEDKVSSKLKEMGIGSSDISHVILSHFHADHIGGLKEFGSSKYIYTSSSYSGLKNLTGVSALKKGFLPDLIPLEFEQNSIALTSKNLDSSSFLNNYFSKVYDVFGDGSIMGVEIPGHAKGQLGLYFETEEQKVFLIADACYLSKTYEELIYPSEVVHIINDSRSEYLKTIKDIHVFHKEHNDVLIVPSHCGDKFNQLIKSTHWDSADINTGKGHG